MSTNSRAALRPSRLALGLALLSFLHPQFSTLLAQGTAFTYQGRLNNGGVAASGSYDMTFTLFAANSTGAPVAGPETNSAVPVSNGVFTTTVDFGAGIFTGGSNWLEIAISTNGANSFVTLTPRQRLTPAPYAIFANSASNVLGIVSAAALPNGVGGSQNAASGYGAVVGGGGQNSANGYGATVSGGVGNNVTDYSTIAGGLDNVANLESFVGGGEHNTASGGSGVIVGGIRNVSTSDLGFIGGGQRNTNSAELATIGGGTYNTASGRLATVGGGSFNVASAAGAFIGGGGVDANNDFAGNQAVGVASSVVGGMANFASGAGSFIGGGGFDGTTISGNYAWGNNSVIAGGLANTTSGSGPIVGCGEYNAANNDFAAVVGGYGNNASGIKSFIGGGGNSSASGLAATVPGGSYNVASGNFSFAAGQQAQAMHQGAFVWADSQNAVFSSSTNDQFLIRARGGVGIDTSSTSEGDFSINTNTYLFSHALYLRGESGSDHNHGLAYNGNTITNFGSGQFQIDGPALFGYAGGLLGTRNGGDRALLMWNTSSIGIGTNNPTAKLQITSNGNQSSPQLRIDQTTTGDFARIRMVSGTTTGVWDIAAGGGGSGNVMNFFVSPTIGGGGTNILQLQPTGNATLAGTLSQSSDRARKENLKAIDPLNVLARVSELPISEWNYITEPGVEHVGPMAQDFYAAFGVGPDDKHITTVDEGGVALAAIQGLNEKVKVSNEKAEGEIQELKAENAELKQRLAALERIILKQN